ncbi:hypothetical protein D9619_003740 [Psilocybe cf. subviscida]|uniref:Carboxypeptidase n=1 Tax=Psilocybe cf. subviscida TaxID=2480587 RepID=A0A8H5AYG8_9AGAR|nr:hypothetical protein D9619_003740 [Psilocybe cf. subviscida]
MFSPSHSVSVAWALYLCLTACAARMQSAPTQNLFGNKQYSDGVFMPVESLSNLSDYAFTTMSHPTFPRYSVRIKKSHFCDETVNAYTGYIDIEARHLFFYFFESRNDPTADDIILWTNGGPGCSSALGMLMELGPCRALSPNGTTYHPESWNTNANVLFIDQPVGVGFSYADHGEFVGNSIDAGTDVAAFLAIFFENFTQFKGRALHLAGESYAGRYIPVFASAVYDQNAKLEAAGLTPINLQSAIIGNGMTDPFVQFLSYYDFVCTPATVSPVVDIASCVAMKSIVKRCERWMRESCEDLYDFINCGAAANFCRDAFTAPFEATGLNVYDITKPCEGEEDDICYPETRHIRNYLDRPDVRSLLGVDPSFTKNFMNCGEEVFMSFEKQQDLFHPSTDYVSALLERGVRILIYVGANDWIANHVGNERWTLALQWTGSKEFNSQPLRDWEVDGRPAGKTRSAKGFTFVTIQGGGHMAPYDKPKESLHLIQRWIAGKEL